MRDVLTPALWASAGHAAREAKVRLTRTSHLWHRIKLIGAIGVGRQSLGVADALEDHARRGCAHALGVGIGERREGLPRFAGVSGHDLRRGRKPRRSRKIDGLDERCLFGVVRTLESRCQRLGLGDLALKLVKPDTDGLEKIENEALVEVGLQ